MELKKHLLNIFLLVILSNFVSSRVVLKNKNDKISLPICSFNEAVETGRIQDPELVEASGMVASRTNPGVYYSIQDSLNPDFVYAFKENGESIGKFDLEGIDQNDWEDISMGPGPDGVDYLYISDTGNNWDGHCRGIDYDDMTIYRFPEPDLSKLKNGLSTIPASEVTTMTLGNPNQPDICDDQTKQDFESLMVDPISGDIYLAQKNVFTDDVTLYKFTPSETGEKIMLQDLGKITSNNKRIGAPGFVWPMGITAADMTRDGSTILVRNYQVVHVWKRTEGQTVEEAILQNEPCEFTLKDEPLGESLAIRHEENGFITTSDGQANAPLYFYEDK